MNIEIANRLVNLRKNKNFSQEALAERLGISRQAVSKWERAEASPDTDNLILLARLYGISLDDLLKTEEEIPISILKTEITPDPQAEYEAKQEYETNAATKYETNAETTYEANAETTYETNAETTYEANAETTYETNAETIYETDSEEYVNIGFRGVHVKDRDGSEVHVGWDGIHVNDQKRNQNVDVDGKGVYVNGKKMDKNDIFFYTGFPFGLIIVIAYMLLGVFWNAWHPSWLLFLLIPIWYSFAEAVKKNNPKLFAYPVLAAFCYLCLGCFFNLWHPGWLIFLTVPLYYPLAGYMRRMDEDNS